MIELQLVNTSDEEQWVTLLYLDGNFGIHIWAAEAVRARQSLEPLVVEVDDKSLGCEGFIVFAAPVRQYVNMPDYTFLQQEGLGMQLRGVVAAEPVASTPFLQQLRAVRHAGPVWDRTEMGVDAVEPQILSWVWESVATVDSQAH